MFQQQLFFVSEDPYLNFSKVIVFHFFSHSKHKKENLPSANTTKRAYTEDELSAAVSEIQNGKLGTRRASVLYGIPRSTLRNKIFRMGSEKIDTAEDPPEIEEKNSEDKNLKWEELFQQSSLPFSLALPHLSLKFLSDAIERETARSEAEEVAKKLETIRKKHNLTGRKETYATEYAHELKIPFLQDMIKRLAEERFEMERNASRVRDIKQEIVDFTGLKLPTILGKTESPAKSASPENVPYRDIIIPSYHSTRHPIIKEEPKADLPYTGTNPMDKYENSRIGDTLKDIIMKTITEKVKSKTNYDPSLYRSGLTDAMKSHSSPTYGATPPKLIKREIEDKKRDSSSFSPVSPTKKTRPKRGQYRKYNSQLLMEAVKAVQRGEMSVHRAGSYYGVPHSTLEYKVKERHLLRQKKIKEQQAQKDSEANNVPKKVLSSNKSNSKDSVSIKSPIRGETARREKESKENPAAPWYSPYLMGAATAPLDPANSLGFYSSSSFALNTPASELLRKLQHKVQSKSLQLELENNNDKVI